MNLDLSSITSVEELQNIIKQCEKRIEEINPYGNLKSLSNKEFGEEWSESFILKKCSNLQKDNNKGHDMISKKFGRIEVKSSRLPCKSITYNQCHPFECEYFLFVNYDTIKGSEEIFLVPSKDFINEELFSKSVQHSRTDNSCYSMRGSTKKNKESLKRYQFESFEKLNKFLEI